MKKIKCKFNINGIDKNISIYKDKPLIYVIRDDFGLIGTKLGCGLEQCGSCAVIIDGEKKLSCNIHAKDYQKSKITTIEGLSSNGTLNAVQKAFKKFNAAQCGYCTSGIIISLSVLFNKKSNPTNDEIINSLDGQLCRCGSHSAVFDAIESIKKNK
tara:strand:+ start:1814 stop:2281 length:468 start_codon:yes stop_codon:yes gene_type:complete